MAGFYKQLTFYKCISQIKTASLLDAVFVYLILYFLTFNVLSEPY